MTIRVKTDTGLLCAYKPCLRHPRRPEMTFVVRGRYRLAPGLPLALRRSDAISDELIERTRKDSATAARELEDASLTLGQDAMSGERFDEADEEQAGAPLYPGDFADWKPRADVLLRGSCHPPRRHDTECQVGFGVGNWKKTLKVVGHRVWVDRAMGGKHTDPAPIGSIALDLAHAHGGPGFADNPVGKGHVEPGEGPVEDIYQPPRSERSAVMPLKQLANVLHEDGRPHKNGVPATFAPLSPRWRHRAAKLGTKYDQEWLDTRAPCFATDMDWTYFNAAPPDQQLDGYLRGDEELTFENLYPGRSRFAARLPGLRVRVFVRDVTESAREVPMKLDTLFADLEDGSLYLTWRGVTPVKEEDLTDVEYALVVAEPLAEAPRPATAHLADLEAFAADPIGLNEAFPAGLTELGERVEKLEDATEAELDAMLDGADGSSPPVAMVKNLFGPLAPTGLGAFDRLWSKAVEQQGVGAGAMRTRVKGGLKRSTPAGNGGVGLRMPVRAGEAPIFPIGNLVRAQEKKLLEVRKNLPPDAPPSAAAKIDAALVKLRTNPDVLAADPRYRPFSETDPPPDEPGPGADLRGRDLSHRDLRGIDLSGADLQCAILTRTDLRGARLAGARLGGARLDLVDLSDADLTDVDLTSASLDRVTARGAKLVGTRLDMVRATGCDFTGASFARAIGLLGTFSKSVFTRVDFTRAALELCSFDVCDIGGARLAAKLEHVRFDDCRGEGVVLDGAELLGASFNDCELPALSAAKATGEGAIFFRTRMPRAIFRRADLKASHFFGVDAAEAVFAQANLQRVRFDRAILRGASFERANLLEADLRKAVLTRTSFHRAILHGAMLTETAGADVDFTEATLDGANLQRSTITTLGGGPR